MRKRLIGVAIFATLVVAGVLAMGSVSVPVQAKKPVDACITIQKGDVLYKPGHFLTGSLETGYDAFGYNFQAHMFNGSLANAYLGRPGSAYPPYQGDDVAYLADNPAAASHSTWPFRDVQLQMKWNDVWLSNKDCDGIDYSDHHSTTLDRHYGYPSYIGSGAWLTNHARGTYTSSIKYHWETTGTHVISFVLGLTYPHDIFLTDTAGVLTGNGGYPVAGPYSYTWDITSGMVSGDNFSFDAVYTDGLNAVGTVMHVTGLIASDGSISGSWDDNYLGGYRVGTWTMPAGTATKVYETCMVSDFVKIVAAPVGAYVEGDYWKTADGEEIGPVIWGAFAIIQEIASDPCGEYGVIDYLSPLRAGLGNW